jgi:cytochrome c
MNKATYCGLGLCLSVALMGGQALAEGDLAAGERNFRQCAACHQLDEGVHRVGPSLHGVFGRPAGTAEGFNYSPDLVAAGEAGVVWNEETLFDYLENPVEFLKKVLDKGRVSTRMPNRFAREDFRRDLIAYLKQELGE